MKWPANSGLPAFCVTGALSEVWALLQKLLSMNYSNLVTAAFNCNTEAESSKKHREADREGMALLGVREEKETQGFRRWGRLKMSKSARPESSRGWRWIERVSLEKSNNQTVTSQGHTCEMQGKNESHKNYNACTHTECDYGTHVLV